MILRILDRVIHQLSLPRMRGDDPAPDTMRKGICQFAPHARG